MSGFIKKIVFRCSFSSLKKFLLFSSSLHLSTRIKHEYSTVVLFYCLVLAPV